MKEGNVTILKSLHRFLRVLLLLIICLFFLTKQSANRTFLNDQNYCYILGGFAFYLVLESIIYIKTKDKKGLKNLVIFVGLFLFFYFLP